MARQAKNEGQRRALLAADLSTAAPWRAAVVRSIAHGLLLRRLDNPCMGETSLIEAAAEELCDTIDALQSIVEEWGAVDDYAAAGHD